MKKKFTQKKLLVFCILLFSFHLISNAQNVTVTGADATTNAGSPYATLKAAFDNINLVSQTGNAIVIGVAGNTTETASAVLNAGTWASITINPTGGAARTISGAITAGFPLIDLNGADNVTINGLNTGGNTLSISNTTSSSTAGTSAIRFIADATSNTITNCTITSNSLVVLGSDGGVISFSTGTTTGNDNNTISNCNISSQTSTINKCIFLGGSSNTDPGSANSGITITGNNIFNFFAATAFSSGIDLSSGSVGTTISNNKFYQTSTRQITSGTTQSHFAIRINNANGNGYQITGNIIGFNSSSGTGTYTLTSSTTAAHVFIPIQLSVGSTTATSVQGNTITNIAISGSTAANGFQGIPFRGINVGGGWVNIGDITANTIGSMSATGSITFTTGSVVASEIIGIYHNSTAESNISNNLIGGITGSNTNVTPTAVNVYGIRINNGTPNAGTYTNNTIGGNVANSIQSTTTAAGTLVQGILNTNRPATITGNIIRNLTAAGGTGTALSASVIGISVNASSYNHNVSQNTIFNLSNNNTTDATVITGISITSNNGTTISANRIYNLSSASTGTGSNASTFSGIQSVLGTHTIVNNQISISQSTANTQPKIYGVELVNTTAHTLHYNSIYIGGTAAASNSSYGIFRTTTGAANVQNNLVYNERSGSGTHFAIGFGGAGAFGTINNNVYVTADASTVGDNAGSSNTLAAWRTTTSGEAASFSYTSSAYPSALFNSISTGDLSIPTPTNQAIVVSRGAVVATTTDYTGATRSGTIPTVGSIEYTEPTLPVTLISYEAKLNTDGTVNLNWLTASETNNSYFEVLRSSNGLDFTSLGKVNGAGNSTQELRYALTDKSPLNGDNYYQLVQHDKDGKKTALGIRTVKVSLKAVEVLIYPNPSTDIVNVVFEAGKFNSIELIDINGRLIQKNAIPTQASEAVMEVRDLPSSNYLIKIVGKQETVTRVLIVKR
jgi:hypothetical protein